MKDCLAVARTASPIGFLLGEVLSMRKKHVGAHAPCTTCHELKPTSPKSEPLHRWGVNSFFYITTF